jgi:Domain of unknown function (DUF4956)
MPQQLKDLLAGTNNAAMQQIGMLPFVFLLAVSLAGSLLAAELYLRFYSSRATGSQVYRAFPLLGLSITAIFVCIQFSLPLSLGLLGALSIVRFRTPIKEPEEIGFIMLVIAASIATATFKLAFVGVLFGLAIAALLIQTRSSGFGRQRLDGTIVVTAPESADGSPVDQGGVVDLLRRLVPGGTLESLARQETALVVSYVFREMPAEALGRLDADLRAVAPGSTFSVFFARPGAL